MYLYVFIFSFLRQGFTETRSLSEISVLINMATDAVRRNLVTLALVIGFKTKNCSTNLNKLRFQSV